MVVPSFIACNDSRWRSGSAPKPSTIQPSTACKSRSAKARGTRSRRVHRRARHGGPQQHGQRYITQFFDYIQQGDLDPAALITHRMLLEDGVRAYDFFKNKKDGCIRVVLQP